MPASDVRRYSGIAVTAPSSNHTAVGARPARLTRGRRLARGMDANTNHLRKLRERFVADPTNTDLSSLRPVIERSWRRSLLWNIDPGRSSFEQVNEPHVDELVMRCAEPVLAELETMATDTGASVFLADPSGTITAFRGDPEVRRVTEKVFPTFGGAMSEDIAGTNAEGTALEEGAAVQIWGSEHFVTSLEQFYCTSVPIRDPLRRSVRGFLSLALPESVGVDVDPASIAMITKGAAAEVTRLLAERLALREKSLLDSYIAEVRKRAGKPLS
jgi:sigma-54 dependent transcriptional regulator, acetoin dehydrogenase operon transcriptional activator AcoR